MTVKLTWFLGNCIVVIIDKHTYFLFGVFLVRHFWTSIMFSFELIIILFILSNHIGILYTFVRLDLMYRKLQREKVSYCMVFFRAWLETGILLLRNIWSLVQDKESKSCNINTFPSRLWELSVILGSWGSFMYNINSAHETQINNSRKKWGNSNGPNSCLFCMAISLFPKRVIPLWVLLRAYNLLAIEKCSLSAATTDYEDQKASRG